MKVDLQPLPAWARRNKKTTRRAERELRAIEASHHHVLGKRKLIVQEPARDGSRKGGTKLVDVAALRLLDPRRRETDLEERIRALEENARVQDVRLDDLEAARLAED